MKNGEIIELYETLKRISENHNIKFNVAVGYALIKNKERLRQEAMLIYEMRRQIVMEHGTLENNIISVDKNFIAETNQKINDLMELDTQIELNLIPFQSIENLELNLEDIEGLSKILTFSNFTSTPIEEKTEE